MKRFQRVMSLLLAVLLCFSMMPVSALAAEEEYLHETETVVEEAPAVEETPAAEIPAEDESEPVEIPAEEAPAVEETPAAEIPAEDESEPVEIPVEETPAAEEEPVMDGAIASGTCGDNLTWSLDSDGVLTILGSGAMYDYGYLAAGDPAPAPWANYRDSITRVVLPDAMTTIGDYAFYMCNALESVSMGSGITAIGKSAFQDCDVLATVDLPDGLTVMEAEAFSSCNALAAVDMPAGELSIGDCAFQFCYALTSVAFHGPVTLGQYAFYSCTALTSVTFAEASGTRIGDYAFASCIKLTGVTIPGGVTGIGDNAFSGCTGLTEVVIQEGVSSIGDKAFYGCTALTSVTIPGTMTKIKENAFGNCDGIKTVYYNGDAQAWAAIDFTNYNACLTGATIVYEDYPSGTCGEDLTWFLDGDGVLTILGTGAMSDYDGYLTGTGTAPWYEHRDSIKSVVIKSGVKTIGANAFYGCVNLENVTLADTVYWLCPFAFVGCSGLTSMDLPASLEYIGEGAFCGSGLTEIVIPDSVTEIGWWAFSGCSGLTRVVIPESVTEIQQDAFEGCRKLERIYILNPACEIAGAESTLGLVDTTVIYGFEGSTAETHAAAVKREFVTLLVKIDEINFPDAAFRSYVSGQVDTDGDGWLSQPEALTGKVFQLSEMGIASLEGIEYFTALETLNCSGNALTELDVSANTALVSLNCAENALTALDVSANTRLEELILVQNPLTEIDVSKNTALKTLLLQQTNITALDVTNNTALECLECGGTDITELDVTNNTALYRLDCGGCSNLTELSVSENTELVWLDCSGTKLIALDVSRNTKLVTLICGGSLASLDVRANTMLESLICTFNPKLPGLDCSNLNLSALDVTGNTAMTTLDCSGNALMTINGLSTLTALESLDISDNAFVEFDCQGMNLVSLDVSGNKGLLTLNCANNALTELNVSANTALVSLNCANNALTALDVSANTALQTIQCGGNALTTLDVSANSNLVSLVCADNRIDGLTLKNSTLTNLTITNNPIEKLSLAGCTALTNIYCLGTGLKFLDASDCPQLVCDKAIPVLADGKVINLTQIGCVDGGWCGDELVWTISYDGVLTVVGWGDITSAPWKNSGYVDTVTSVVIEEDVTGICDEAFNNFNGLQSVSIPLSMAAIGELAFGLETGIQKTIYPGDFDQWDAIDIRYGNRSLWKAGAHYPDKMAEVDGVTWHLENYVLTLSGEGAVPNYEAFGMPLNQFRDLVDAIVIEQGVTAVGDYAFYDCAYALEVTVDVSVHLGMHSFIGTPVKKVTYVGTGKMENYSGDTSDYITTPWYDVRDTLTDVVISKGITQVGVHTFSYCYKLKNVSLPEGLVVIDGYAFYRCTSLAVMNIPASVKTISGYAFQYCSSLADLTIQSTTTDFGLNAFNGCSKLVTAGPIGGDYNYKFGWTTAIPANAFHNCASLTTITLPKTITSLGARAMQGCSSLSYVCMPAGLVTFGEQAVSGCSSLVTAGPAGGGYNYEFEWTEGVPAAAFYECYGLRNVTLPDTMTAIGNSAFQSCYALTDIDFSNSMITIGDSAFSGCSSMKKLDLPDSVTTIGNSAFSGCSGLTSIDLHEGLTSMGSSAFSGCSGLTSIVVPSTLKIIPRNAFSYCLGLTDVTIPEGVLEIQSSAFYYCRALKRVVLPASITTMGWSVFGGCEGLLDVGPAGEGDEQYHIIYSWTESIPANAFSGSDIRTVTIPTTVKLIGDSAFSGCEDLTTVYYAGSLADWYEISVGAGNTHLSNATFVFGEEMTGGKVTDTITWNLSEGVLTFEGTGAIPHYTENQLPIWKMVSSKVEKIVIGEGITSIGNYAFYQFTNATAVEIGGDVTAIGEYAFYGCTGLTALALPEALTSIGRYALYGLTGITAITIPAAVTSIGDYALGGCTALTTVYYGKSEYEWYAIGGPNAGLTNNVTIEYGEAAVSGKVTDTLTWTLSGGTLTISGTGAMPDYTDPSATPWHSLQGMIRAIVIDDGVTYIGQYAFYDTDTQALTIGAGVTSIGQYAFYGSEYLAELTIPGNVKTIGHMAFGYCRTLGKLTISEGVAAIESYAFYACGSLSEVTIPGTVTTIDYYAFRDCDGLLTVTLSEGVATIGGYAFAYCDKLETVNLPLSITGMSSDSFYGSNAMVLVTYPGSHYQWAIAGGTNLWLPTDCEVRLGSETHTEKLTETLTWSVNNEGVLTIRGTGAMPDYTDAAKIPWYAGRYVIAKIVLEEGVTGVGSYAFCYMDNLTEVTIPKSVASIGGNAFQSCSNIETVYYAGSLLDWYEVDMDHEDGYLSRATFVFGEAVTGGDVSDTITWSIAEGVLTFAGAGAMPNYSGDNLPVWRLLGDEVTKIVVSDGITAIGAYAFYDCSAVTEVLIGADVASIGHYAFYGCSALTEITIPENVTSIGTYAFYDCSALTTVNYGGSYYGWIAAGGPNAGLNSGVTVNFGKETAVGTVTDTINWILHDGILTISGEGEMPDYTGKDDAPWAAVRETIVKIVVNDGITRIGQYAFSYCTKAETVQLSGDVKSIGRGAFESCVGLKEIVIPEGVETISINAFWNCSNLTTVSLPASAVNVYWMFNGSSVTTVNYAGSRVEWEILKSNGDPLLPDGCVLNIGKDSYTAALTETLNWTMTNDGVLTIRGEGAMPDYTNNGTDFAPWHSAKAMIVEIVLEDGVTAIGDRAFTSCYNAEMVTIGSAVKTIGEYAFYDCDSLTSIVVPEGTTNIEDQAFANSVKLETVVIPASVTNMEYSVFYDCDALIRVSFGGSCYDWATIGGMGAPCLPAGCAIIFGRDSYTADLTDTLTWTVTNDGVLTIRGEGAMPDYTNNGTDFAPWHNANSMITKIVIGDGVTHVGNYAFYGFCATELEIGSNVETIGNAAFRSSGLTSVTIPATVESVGAKAFAYCNNLESATVGARSIGEYAFYQARSLTTVTLADGVESLDFFSFGYCYALETITIPASVTAIHYAAFAGSSALATVHYGGSGYEWYMVCANLSLPSNCVVNFGKNAYTATLTETLDWTITNDGVLTVSGEGAMPDYTNNETDFAPWHNANSMITKIVIGDGVTHVGNYAFDWCCATELEIGSAVETIGNDAFHNSGLTSVTIPATVESIGANAFAYCNNLESATVGARSIGSYAFYQARSLTTVTLADGVESLDFYSFGYCTALETITIPASATAIDYGAFEGSSALAAVHYGGTGYDWYLACGNGTISLPGNCVVNFGKDAYTAALTETLNWTMTNDGVLTVSGEGAMPDYTADGTNSAPWHNANSMITKIVIGDGVTHVGNYAFDGCCATELEIGSAVETIGNAAFRSSGLTYVTIPATVETIGEYAFQACDNLESATVGARSIGSCAFYQAYSLTTVTLVDGVTSIDSGSFVYCTALETITIPASVTTIAYGAFEGSSALATVHYGGSAYEWFISSGWQGITLPGTCRIVYGKDAYTGACGRNLTFAVENDGTLRISGSGAMYGYSEESPAPWFFGNNNLGADTFINSIVIESGVTTIGAYAFYNLYELAEVTIPDSVTAIGDYAFQWCNSLETVTIPARIKRIGTYAFYGSELETVRFAGQAPTVVGDYAVFNTYGNRVTCYYPYTDESWTADAMALFGDVVWEPYNFGTVETLTVSRMPYTTGYEPGAELVLTGLKLTAVYDSGYVETVSASQVTVGEYDLSTDGVKTISVSYGGKTAEFAVVVHSTTVTTPDESLWPESDHPYANNSATTDYTFTQEGAYSITITFSEDTEVEDYFDYLYVYDGDGTCMASFTGYIGGESVTVMGDTVRISLRADDGGDNYGFSLSDVKVTSVGHVFTETVVPPTCTQQGYTANLCPCGVMGEKTDITEATGHSYGEWTTYKAMSCNPWMDGEERRTCTACGEYESRTVTADHDYQISRVVEPTCMAWGETTYTCTRCGVWCSSNGNGPLGHSYGDWYIEGELARRDCVRCDSYESMTYSIVAQGACGDNLTWKLENTKRLVVSGTGDMWDYEAAKAPWYDYGRSDYIDTIVLEPGVTGIGDYAFYFLNISKVVMSDTITSVGDYAFSDCYSLNQVVFSQSLETIGKCAFFFCRLDSIVIPDSVITIGDYSFDRCKVATELVIGNSVTTIGNWAFNLCESVTEVVIPASVTCINAYAFYDCAALRKVTILNPECEIVESERMFGSPSFVTICGEKGSTAQAYAEAYGYAFEIVEHVHRYDSVVTAPTCTEGGYTTHTCSGCDDSYVDSYTEAVGHSWDEGAVTTEPTLTTMGQKTYTCKACKETRSETITLAPGDANGDGDVTAADLVSMVQYILAGDATGEEPGMDVTGDGKTNILDLVRVMRYLAGFDVKLA